jgi:hypothetical protein
LSSFVLSPTITATVGNIFGTPVVEGHCHIFLDVFTILKSSSL